ncbi:MAG: SHOCT domain-containing protein [Clostridiales Family XIII bacterium]|jgi:uncharacterized membrane protein|nr:SHOCT domain-containing protein [Clostridiales Family XIII bacterium]
MNTLDEIAKLKGLLDDGAITQEEFETMKADLLAKERAPDSAAYAAAGAAAGNKSAGAGAPPNYGQQQGQGQPGGQQQYGQPNYGAGAPGHVPGTAYANYQEDVAANKVFGVLSYLFCLCFISMFAAPKESHYSRFHANQGLVLFLFELGGIIVFGVIMAIVAASSAAAFYAYGGVNTFVGLGAVGVIRTIYGLATTVLAILGIINAVQGNEKPLPVIGGIRILK